MLFETIPIRACGLIAASNSTAPLTGRRRRLVGLPIRHGRSPHDALTCRGTGLGQEPTESLFARLIDRAPPGQDVEVQFLEDRRMRGLECIERPLRECRVRIVNVPQRVPRRLFVIEQRVIEIQEYDSRRVSSSHMSIIETAHRGCMVN